MADIIERVYEMNFGVLEKKIGKFLGTIQKLFLQEKSSAPSSEIIPSIVSKTSLEDPSETEVLQ
jgi:hypothetical protein